MKRLTFEQTIQALRAGRPCIFPTETLYALGCVATDTAAVEAIFRLKGRPAGKPLPCIIGSRAQLNQVAATADPVSLRLMDAFWPGPLSVLLSALACLSPLVTGPADDGAALVAVRRTSHPLASQLCLELGAPLTATSANIAGRSAPSAPDEIDPALASESGGVLADQPWPSGGDPSTVVQVREGRVHILRHGAVSRKRIESSGFYVA